MDQANGTTKKKHVLFSIGSYSEKDKRVINKISKNGPFSSPSSPSSTLPREQPLRTILKDRSQPSNPPSTDSTDAATPVKHHTLPRATSTPAPIQLVTQTEPVEKEENLNNGSERNNGHVHLEANVVVIEKPTCPPSRDDDAAYCTRVVPNGGVEKPRQPPKIINRSISLEPEQLRHTGKVALTIAAYEGEPRTPTRLEFLPQPATRLSRSSSKASSSDASGSVEEAIAAAAAVAAVEPIGSRLQDELVATLKRSNLKKRNDAAVNGKDEPMEIDEETTALEQTKEKNVVPNGSVKQLATELDKIMTFRINPDDTEQIHDNKE